MLDTKKSLLFFILALTISFLYCDEIIKKLLDYNYEQQQETVNLLSLSPSQKNYSHLKEFWQQHPENIEINHYMIYMADKLYYLDNLRVLYLKKIRSLKIKLKKDSIAQKIALTALHYGLGCLHCKLYNNKKNNNNIYLALDHFEQSIQISKNFLLSWLQAAKIFKNLKVAYNSSLYKLCRYNIYKIWNNKNLNTTLFRIYPSELKSFSQKNKISIKSAKKNSENASHTQDFVKELIEFKNWFPGQKGDKVNIFLHAASFYYLKYKRNNSEKILKQGLHYSNIALNNLLESFKTEQKGEKQNLEITIRRYIAWFCYKLKKYPLAEEQDIIINFLKQ